MIPASTSRSFDRLAFKSSTATMRVLLALFAVVGVISAVYASDDPTGSLPGVEDLTPDNFDKLVNGAKHVLVEFYAPWCGHCKHMVPEYKKLAELVGSDPLLKSKVVVAKVNADAHRSLGEKFDVKGFPTIKFFPRGKPATKDFVEDYNSARTSDKFFDFLKDKVEADKGFARVEVLDPIAKKFAEAADKSALVAEVEGHLKALEGEAKANGELYLKFMQKALDKGADYLTKEKARLERMIGTGSVAPAKVTEMSKKTSILGAFTDEE